MTIHRIVWSFLALLLPVPFGPAACGGADAQADVATPESPGGAPGGVAVGDNSDTYQDNDPAALQDFQPVLQSYGTWQDDPTYGTLWVPSPQIVGSDFTPYASAGHWVYDNDQYVWVSDYDWGWAPFHYGRWVPLDGGGWAWIPGRAYRGAWVNWGADDGYATVGWYPLGPEFVWRGGVAVSYTYAVGPRWAYAGRADVFAPNIGARVIVGPAGARFADRVRPIEVSGGARFSSGPPPTRLGFAPGQVPHVSGADAARLAKATAWAHPSTAVAQGAHPATHTAALAAHGSTPTTRGGATTPSPSQHGTTPAARSTPMTRGGATPAVQPQPRKRAQPQGNTQPSKGGSRGGTKRR